MNGNDLSLLTCWVPIVQIISMVMAIKAIGVYWGTSIISFMILVPASVVGGCTAYITLPYHSVPKHPNRMH